MSARAPIGASNRSDLFTSRSSGRQDTQEHRKVSVEQEYEAKQEEEDDDPLQLEHMLGYSGVFPKTVIASPYDENTFVKRCEWFNHFPFHHMFLLIPLLSSSTAWDLLCP